MDDQEPFDPAKHDPAKVPPDWTPPDADLPENPRLPDKPELEPVTHKGAGSAWWVTALLALGLFGRLAKAFRFHIH